jgi:NAD(P)-dependent dehydrogenase (short-subunit alcohol dehydrogenase family)
MVWLSPFEWVTEPGMLLEAITKHRATVTWLPNFAFAFLAQSVSDPPESFDLSSIRTVLSGGEPATEASMEAFYERYVRSGFKREALQVGYGMAETVCGVTFSCHARPPRFYRISKRRWTKEHVAVPPEEADESIVHVSSGFALDGCLLRVVDAEKKPLPPRHAGRILVKSTYMFSGYYRRDDLNQNLFDAEGFFDTGDVGYLDEDGQLYVTGRIKDLIKIGGRAVYPQDVEEVLNAIPGVHPGRAVCFGVPVAAHGTEGLVILVESDLPEAEWNAQVARIRAAVVETADVDVFDIKVITRNLLRKSTAGKLARDGNRTWYLDGRFGPLPPLTTKKTAAPEAFNDCAYAVEWRLQDLPAKAPSAAGGANDGAWLVVLDARGTGAAVAECLRARGEACVEALLGASYERLTDRRWRVDATKPAELDRLVEEAFGKQRVCSGVVHCASLDTAPWDETTGETLAADLRRGSLVAMRLAQALLRLSSRDAPRLVFVTRGAQAAGRSPAPGSVGQAPLWGLGRTIALEHPELECLRLDLPLGPLAGEADRVAREITEGDGEDQIALRAEGRFVARLVRSSFDSEEAVIEPRAARRGALVADGSYLITGGLGGLGLTLARWMVAQGARHLVLVEPSAPPAAAHAAIRALEEAGAKVHVLRGDVAHTADVESVLRQIKEGMPSLRGVVHAAAALDDRALLEMGEEQFWTPLRLKALGAWSLHAATRGLPLDFFVMASSVTALLGSPGQSNDVAANAFLDALARARVAEGLPAMSLQWGPVADLSSPSSQENRRQRLSSQGIESFMPEEATELFSWLLQRPRAESGLVRLSTRQWLESHPQASGMRFLTELEDQMAQSSGATTGSFRAALDQAPSGRRAALVEEHLIEQLAHVLGLDLARVDRRAPFTSLGMSSRMGVELRNRLETSLELRLPTTLLFTYPSSATLSDYLLTQLEPAPEVPRAAPAPLQAAAKPGEDLEHLSGDDLLAMLDEELSMARKHEEAK